MSHNVSVLRLLQCPVTFNLVRLNSTSLQSVQSTTDFCPIILAAWSLDHSVVSGDLDSG